LPQPLSAKNFHRDVEHVMQLHFSESFWTAQDNLGIEVF